MIDDDNSDDGFRLATQDDINGYLDQQSSVPQDRSTPMDRAVAQLNDAANAQIKAGAPEDQVQADLVSKLETLQAKQVKPSRSQPAKSGDDGFRLATVADVQDFVGKQTSAQRANQPSELETDNQAASLGYRPSSDYNPVALSPVTREAPADNGDVPAPIPDLTNQARAADAAAAGATDNRREVGFGENLWRQANCSSCRNRKSSFRRGRYVGLSDHRCR